MKRILAMMLVLLLLSGCANRPQEPTTTETTAATQPGLYLPDSDAELNSGGALRAYGLENRDYYALSAIGDQLLLLAGDEKTRLELYTGTECVPAGSAELSVPLQSGWQALYHGFAYYDAAQKQAVFLDPQLHEQSRIDLPQDILGMPAFSADGGEIFYCQGQEIRALDTEHGISRLIKSHACVDQTLLGAWFDGALVLCRGQKESGEMEYMYVSTQDGATKSSGTGIQSLDTFEDRFFAHRMDGITRQYLFGTESAVQQLNISDTYAVSAVQLGGAVGITAKEDGTWGLSYYDLTSGKKTAAVSVQQGEPISFLADRWSSCIWILVSGEEEQTLLRWDIKASPVEEETVYTGSVYTATSPDTAGLDLLQDRVDELNRTHGVDIRIWQTALKTTGGNQVVAEYQVEAVCSTLDQVERVLSRFPEKFLYKSVNDKIRMCIVRSVGSKSETIRFWDDGDAFILLCPGEHVEQDLLRAIAYIVDSHILGNSPMVDDWENLNPEGFAYGTQDPDANLLEGQTRAFVNETAMGSVSDDRAMLFWQAMQPDNAELFASDVMQAKLLLLCRSIRDAWGLEKKTDTYPWEQYLDQSIAYVK